MSIGKIRYPQGRLYTCDECEKVHKRFKNYPAAILAGWAISRDRQKCYCPNCAPNHRNTGRGGAPLPLPAQPDWVPAGWKQETIDLK